MSTNKNRRHKKFVHDLLQEIESQQLQQVEIDGTGVAHYVAPNMSQSYGVTAAYSSAAPVQWGGFLDRTKVDSNMIARATNPMAQSMFYGNLSQKDMQSAMSSGSGGFLASNFGYTPANIGSTTVSLDPTVIHPRFSVVQYGNESVSYKPLENGPLLNTLSKAMDVNQYRVEAEREVTKEIVKEVLRTGQLPEEIEQVMEPYQSEEVQAGKQKLAKAVNDYKEYLATGQGDANQILQNMKDATNYITTIGKQVQKIANALNAKREAMRAQNKFDDNLIEQSFNYKSLAKILKTDFENEMNTSILNNPDYVEFTQNVLNPEAATETVAKLNQDLEKAQGEVRLSIKVDNEPQYKYKVLVKGPIIEELHRINVAKTNSEQWDSDMKNLAASRVEEYLLEHGHFPQEMEQTAIGEYANEYWSARANMIKATENYKDAVRNKQGPNSQVNPTADEARKEFMSAFRTYTQAYGKTVPYGVMKALNVEAEQYASQHGVENEPLKELSNDYTNLSTLNNVIKYNMIDTIENNPFHEALVQEINNKQASLRAQPNTTNAQKGIMDFTLHGLPQSEPWQKPAAGDTTGQTGSSYLAATLAGIGTAAAATLAAVGINQRLDAEEAVAAELDRQQLDDEETVEMTSVVREVGAPEEQTNEIEQVDVVTAAIVALVSKSKQLFSNPQLRKANIVSIKNM